MPEPDFEAVEKQIAQLATKADLIKTQEALRSEINKIRNDMAINIIVMMVSIGISLMALHVTLLKIFK